MNKLNLSLCSIILAAGFSSRMKFFKPIMYMGNKTLLEHVILLYQSVRVNDIFIVTGNKSEKIDNIASQYNVKIIYNKQYKQGMFSSIIAGISQLPKSVQYFFVHPVDIPLIRSYTISKLINKALAKKKDIIYPVFDNKRGHPPLISTKLKNKIMNWKGGGLNSCLQNNNAAAINVPVADQAILTDVDTIKDYNKLIMRFNNIHSLLPKECEVLMNQIIGTPNKVIKHCKTVAKIAVRLANNINKTGKVKLDTDLIYSSSLVHDMAKNYMYHDKVGAKILREMGYKKMAKIVEKHVNLVVEKVQPINETEIVYIADKLTHNNNVTSLNTRFKMKKREYIKDPYIEIKMASRIRSAYNIKNKIEKTTSQPIEKIIENL